MREILFFFFFKEYLEEKIVKCSSYVKNLSNELKTTHNKMIKKINSLMKEFEKENLEKFGVLIERKKNIEDEIKIEKLLGIEKADNIENENQENFSNAKNNINLTKSQKMQFTYLFLDFN